MLDSFGTEVKARGESGGGNVAFPVGVIKVVVEAVVGIGDAVLLDS